jgi:two-component system sensor histidine kinase KdpD
MLRVFVEDHGPGIGESVKAHVFEPFWHGEDSTSSGVGLAICKAIVEAHGGTIHVESPTGGGARIVFTLPAHHD